MSFSSLPIRVRHALEQASIKTPEELAQRSLLDLQKAKNIGPKTIAVLEAFLTARGLALRVEGAPTSPVPQWLLTYESRARAAGLKCSREGSEVAPYWWLSVRVGPGSTISIFDEAKYILAASSQDLPPRELMARTQTQVLIDALEVIAPEIVEHYAAKREAA